MPRLLVAVLMFAGAYMLAGSVIYAQEIPVKKVYAAEGSTPDGAGLPKTALDLKSVCEASSKSVLPACQGLIRTATEMHHLVALTRPGSALYCLPTNVNLDQLRLIYVKWASDNPEVLHTAAAWGVAAALTDHFPCE